MYLYFFIFLFTLNKKHYAINIKKNVNVIKVINFLNCSYLPRKKLTTLYLSKKETNQHEIYRKRFEVEIKNALQAIIYKKGVKLNYKYHIDEDIIEGISIYKVQLSTDCSVAKVIVEIMGDSIDSRQGFIWIQKNCKAIRYRLAQLIKHRKKVPFLNFELSNLSEQTHLFCEIENMREYYADMFKEDIQKGKVLGEENLNEEEI
ncbi:ribosome-binding factor A, putative [Hepatocystis sp. ex Piliocolobus tephrosceles]|nr:ribosome-binding factor A, putative [Hepatocystis sp. ex Piliocolobus tephrosceles]